MITAVKAIVNHHTTGQLFLICKQHIVQYAHQNLGQKLLPMHLKDFCADPPNLCNPRDVISPHMSMGFLFFVFVPLGAQVCVELRQQQTSTAPARQQKNQNTFLGMEMG